MARLAQGGPVKAPAVRASAVRASAVRASAIVLFGREWLKAPLRVGAIAPSGARLAELITRELRPADAPVIELGPGTGSFTRAILSRGIPESQLALVERSPAFAEHLRRSFPKAMVLEADAGRIDRIAPFGPASAGAIVCGLPFRSMPNRTVFRIMHSAFRTLRPGGSFYLFTYGHSCPISPDILSRLGLRATLVARTVANLPPARVYRVG
jgi:phospholipid N-methyltransferase